MQKNQQIKATVQTMNPPSVSAPPSAPLEADMEVVARAQRRAFSHAEKRRILAKADACTQPGEIGAWLRQEGVYSSSLSTWRRQREAGELWAGPCHLKSEAPSPMRLSPRPVALIN